MRAVTIVVRDMPTCCVPGCTSGYRNDANREQRHFFCATRGAAPGLVLAKLVLESVLQLEQHGASVIAVVSDGAGNNRSMWTHVGVSGKIDQPVNKIPHPSLEDGRFLHFLCNVPHIVKCVRNNLLTPTYAMVSMVHLFIPMLIDYGVIS